MESYHNLEEKKDTAEWIDLKSASRYLSSEVQTGLEKLQKVMKSIQMSSELLTKCMYQIIPTNKTPGRQVIS